MTHIIWGVSKHTTAKPSITALPAELHQSLLSNTDVHSLPRSAHPMFAISIKECDPTRHGHCELYWIMLQGKDRMHQQLIFHLDAVFRILGLTEGITSIAMENEILSNSKAKNRRKKKTVICIYIYNSFSVLLYSGIFLFISNHF